MDRPLIIYLDTQDYIKIFNERGNGQNQKILEKLLEYRDRGEILIGFSFVIMLEFITKPDEKNRHERVRRGQLVKQICGPNAFPSLMDMGRGSSFPNAGRWMFSHEENVISARDFKDKMKSMFIKSVNEDERFNRKQRRKILRMKDHSSLLGQIGEVWGRKRSDYGDLPISDEFIKDRVFERFLKGDITEEDFENRITLWLSDPAEYSRIIYDYAKFPNVIEKYYGDSISSIEHNLIILQDTTFRIRQLNNLLMNIRNRLIDTGIDKNTARKMTKKFDYQEYDMSAILSEIESKIGSGRGGHFHHYMRRAVNPEYTFKKSDIMDLLQMCYAYDCDLFRCDKAMANTFKMYEPFRGKLVSRFAELPDRISTTLSQK